jgi:HlyD family type I secretion membrane fusion protein
MNMNKPTSLLQRLFRKNQVSKEEYEQIGDEKSPQPKLEIHFSDSKNIIRAGMIVVFLFFGVGGLWVTFAEITGAVIASGEIRVDTERKTVQHLEGGIVRKILVRNGDQVVAGQPLLQLDSTRVSATTDQYLLQLAAFEIEEIRLLAERDYLDEPDWPANDATIPQQKFDELLNSAQKVFSSNRLALENQSTLLRKQISQMLEQIRSMDDRIVAELQVSDTLQEELDAKQVLYEDHYIEKTQILELRRALSERMGVLAQLRGTQAEIRERIAEFELRIDALKSEYRQTSIARLSELQQQSFSLQQQLLPFQDALSRQEITAPVDGEVVAMQVHSEGGVLQPGQPILDIVPVDSPLIVECRIKVSDITNVFKGQMADVQLVAFSARSTPKISGEVVYISADRIMQSSPAGEQPGYIVHVELNKQELQDNNLYLTAGMPAAVFITTKPRTVLDYALEPLTESFDRALREN